MCTSIALNDNGFYFGRNLDLECGFGEKAVITPRNYPFEFRKAGKMDSHYAMIGMAAVQDGYPLYAEAVNEKGLGIAGLNFPGNAYYPAEEAENKSSISPFEVTAWVLAQCASVKAARALLEKTQLVHIDFSDRLPVSPLHWHIADKEESIVLESLRDGMHIYDNPIGVMTNNPPFDFHMTNLNQYLNMTSSYPGNRFSGKADLKPFGVGLGAFGLPGDYSPASRFIKAAFLKLNSVSDGSGEGEVSRFFHLLDAVAMPDGIVQTPGGAYEFTRYSCCADAERGVLYYRTYGNTCLTAVDMRREDLNGDRLIQYELRREQKIEFQN